MQHKDLYRKITGTEEGAFIMKNKIPAPKRVWNKDAKITFSTTGILVNDLETGKLDLSDYDLLVNDECDLALGNHVAARLARAAKAKKIPMLCLTATLGSKKTKETIMRNCGIYDIIEPGIPQRPRHEYPIDVEMTPVLAEIDGLFVDLMQKDFDYLRTFVKALKKREGILCSQDEMNAIAAAIEICFGGNTADGSRHPEYFDAISNFAYYRKLRTAHRKCLVNSYDVFREYAETLKIGGDKILAKIEGVNYSKAADRIIHDPRFKKIEELVEKDLGNHPKFNKFEEHIGSPYLRDFKRIVFVDEVETARFFESYFAGKYGLKTASYVSVHTAEEKRLREQLRIRINAGELDVVFGTSALERGIDAKVDEVDHYTIAMERRAREQKSGRAGRFSEGYVYHFCLKHPLDKTFFWATSAPKTKEKKQKRRNPYFFENKSCQTTLEFPYEP